MEKNQELEMMKDGARRVEQYLASQGITIKHSMMLEALSAGFGTRNWRTVQQKLNAPSAPPEVTLVDLEGKRWEVHAIYEDNNQPYCDYYAGENPMEAAINAQVERMMAEDGEEVRIVSVIDRLTHRNEDYCGSEPDCQIVPHSKALGNLGVAARKLFPVLSKKREAAASKEDHVTAAAIEILEEISKGEECREFCVSLIDEIDRWTQEWNKSFKEGERFLWNLRCTEVDISGSEAVAAVLKVLAAGKGGVDGLPDALKQNFYQAQALLQYAKHELDFMMGDDD